MLESRWYEIVGDGAIVYDSPYTESCKFSSHVQTRDLEYYRRNFRLRKIVGPANPLKEFE